MAALERLFPDPEAVADRLLAIARAAYDARPDELHALDERRLAAPDWFQRPDALGYAAYADRFAGTLAGVAAHVDHLTDLGVTYLHLMPLLTPRAGAERRRLCGGRLPLGARRPRRHRRPARPGHHPARARHQPVHRPGAQPHGPRAPVGPGRAGGRRRQARLLPRLRRPRPARPVRTVDARGLSRLRPGQLLLGRRAARLGLDDLQLLPVGPQLGQPRRAVRVRRHPARAGQPRRRGVPARRDRLPLEADGHHLPEPARGARPDPGAADGGPDRLPGGAVQGRGDRRPGRPAGLPRDGRPRRQGLATSPTTTA